MLLSALIIISLSTWDSVWGSSGEEEEEQQRCQNTISPYLINASHSRIELLWKKARLASAYCLCHGGVAHAGFTADFEGCDGGPRWHCHHSEPRTPAAISAAQLEPATEHVFCARRQCLGGGYSPHAECARVRSAQREGWKFTVDLMEPRRALLLWTGSGSREVTWCRLVGALSVCQNKSSGTDGVVINDLDAWRTYDVSVGGGPTRDSEPLFAAHFRTRPDTPSAPVLLHVEQVGAVEVLLPWSAPEYPRGPLQAYDVSWCSGQLCESLETPRETRHAILRSVRPSTNYTVRVRAKNVLEDVPLEGPHAEVTVFTPPGACGLDLCPGLVFRLEMSAWMVVSLSWTGVGVSTVKHCLMIGSCEKSFVLGGRKEIANSQPWTLASLEATDTSDALLFYTVYRSPPGRPSAPRDVRVFPVNSSALELRWSVPERCRGPVDGYLVRWQTFYAEGEALRLGSRDLRSLLIGNVEELNTYTVQVAAYNLWSGSFLSGDEAIAYGISYSSGMHVDVSSGATWAELRWTLRRDVPEEELLLTCCEPDQQDTCAHEARLNTSARRHLLRPLEPARAYDVRFFRIRGMALLLRKRFSTGRSAAEKAGLPTPNVTSTFLGDGSVLVSWGCGEDCTMASSAPSDNESGSDENRLYRVSWASEVSEGYGDVHQAETTSGTEFTLRGLLPSTTYAVEVRFLGSYGSEDAPHVWTLSIETPPAAATKIEDVVQGTLQEEMHSLPMSGERGFIVEGSGK